MSWEALRLTSKKPSELLTILGPHGVDHLIRQALDVLWREYPEDSRTLENVKRRAREVYDRNMRIWTKIKKPAPQAYFEHLLPYAADGFVRQALVLSWMMMPRAGGRKFSDTKKKFDTIWNRNIAAWDADHETFSVPAKKSTKKSAPKSKSKKKTSKKK